MPTKCCWVINGSLTSERKASTSPSSFINHSILLLNRALKRQAPCLYIDMHFEVRAFRTRRRVGSARRRGNHMHDHSRFQRDINDVTGVSLSLSLPLTKVTHAQYAKLLVFTLTCTSKFEHSERVDALGLRVVEVIICMITRDFSVISMTSQASLSLSLSPSHKSHSRTI